MSINFNPDPAVLDLPDDILALSQMRPLEEFALYAMRHHISSTPVLTLIPEKLRFSTFYLVRREPGEGSWRGDHRFIDDGGIVISAYSADPNGEERASVMADAARVAMVNAQRENLYVPGAGWISRVKMPEEPVRKADWASSVGPVQYADLHSGFWRYEVHFQLMVRRELN